MCLLYTGSQWAYRIYISGAVEGPNFCVVHDAQGSEDPDEPPLGCTDRTTYALIRAKDCDLWETGGLLWHFPAFDFTIDGVKSFSTTVFWLRRVRIPPTRTLRVPTWAKKYPIQVLSDKSFKCELRKSLMAFYRSYTSTIMNLKTSLCVLHDLKVSKKTQDPGIPTRALDRSWLHLQMWIMENSDDLLTLPRPFILTMKNSIQ